jgi:hypothetical protein
VRTVVVWSLGLAVAFLAGSAVEQWIPGARLDVATQTLTPPAERVTIEVRNAGGVSGAARGATERLRSIGYDVVRFGNDDAFDLDRSVVVDRVGDRAMAEAVAQALGIETVESWPDSTLFVDVTVRLGASWTPQGYGEATDDRPGLLGRLRGRR